MRRDDGHQGVSDALQADVMRFMAIIAFCLIAILALVRSVEPPTGVPEAAAADPAPTAEAAPPPAATPPAVPAPPPAVPERHDAGFAAPSPDAADPVIAAQTRQPVPGDLRVVPSVREAEPTPPPAARPRPKPAAIRPPAPAAAPDEPAPLQPPVAARRGLSLRFASERDFLRLVNRGAIQLFAFREGEVLAVSADFRLQPATAPGELHELLPETIPALMLSALDRKREAAAWRWGIAMPVRMAAQIRGFVDRGVSGELIIDRHGEVRHHEA